MFMQIFIRMLTGRAITLEVEQRNTIADIMAIMQRIEGIPPEQQRLHYNNRVLRADRTLADYGIRGDNTLTLVGIKHSRPTLRMGARGEDVRELQELLVLWGYYAPAPVDGIFGPLTQSAVMAFQRDQEIAVDGIVGPITWNALLSIHDILRPPSFFNYIVQPGDSLWLIAQKFGTTVDILKSLNNLTGDMILTGQILRVPYEAGVTPPAYFEYTVRSGDSLWLIAQLFGTTVDAIKALNGLTDDMILVGQVLKIPDEFANIPPPPPIVRPTLRMGDTGLHVAVLQAQLHFWLFLPGPVDGIFGPQTQRAVMAFQRDHGLDVDGIVGAMTWEALFDYSSIDWNHANN